MHHVCAERCLLAANAKVARGHEALCCARRSSTGVLVNVLCRMNHRSLLYMRVTPLCCCTEASWLVNEPAGPRPDLAGRLRKEAFKRVPKLHSDTF